MGYDGQIIAYTVVPPMLNQESLSQLKGLKSQMEAEKEHAEAVVKGTASRYGFAVLEDGREIFIPPQEMLKVFPDDRVRICIRPTRDNKTIADIEKLLDSPLDAFTGRCVRKGKAIFVDPDLPQLSRWLFIPPHARNGVKEGDYIHCAILRHPIKDGKPQAKVLSVLGQEDTPGVENLYCMRKHELPASWSNQTEKSLLDIPNLSKADDSSKRRDCTDLEFVSIDAAKTQDIDDALYAEIRDGGWNLYVAIADPTAIVQTNSPIYADVAKRATSVYFHGDVLPMLPVALSQDTCALSEDVVRPALICKIAVSDEGEVGECEIFEATVRSRAKLSYYAVDRYLNGQYDELMSHATPLEALYQVYRALRAHREAHGLVMEDRQEYRWILGDNKQIDSIEPYEKLLSQKLVEECMVAANRCAAKFLSEKGASGPFVSHPGFRGDRLEEARKFFEMHAPELNALDTNAVEGYRDIMRGLADSKRELPLRAMVNRLLTRATLTTRPGKHMGMALECYTNCTSPLRKQVDFLVHLQIKSLLNSGSADLVDDALLEQVAKRISAGRAATLEAERWLAGNYLQRKAAEGTTSYAAKITHVTSAGFNVRLDSNGLEGFIDLRKDPEKFSYDKWTASLTSTTRRFAIAQSVELEFQGIDKENTFQAKFLPSPECGTKAQKEVKDDGNEPET
ncbi:MAG: ribonuclease R family protein [Halioglobus sp.]